MVVRLFHSANSLRLRFMKHPFEIPSRLQIIKSTSIDVIINLIKNNHSLKFMHRKGKHSCVWFGRFAFYGRKIPQCTTRMKIHVPVRAVTFDTRFNNWMFIYLEYIWCITINWNKRQHHVEFNFTSFKRKLTCRQWHVIKHGVVIKLILILYEYITNIFSSYRFAISK